MITEPRRPTLGYRTLNHIFALRNVPKQHQNSSADRLVELDVLRGIAILLVIGFHCVINPKDAGFFSPLALGIKNFGWSGVNLFFVLSGFLIGKILFKEIQRTGSLNLLKFYIRRGFRIWPSYYLFLGCYAIALVSTGKLFDSAYGNLTACLFFLQNLNTSMFPPFTWHLWSLCVEEHFYLAFPLLLLFLIKRFSLKQLPKVIVGVCIFCLISRSIQIFAGIKADSCQADNFWINTFNRVDAPLAGVFLAYLSVFKPMVWAELGQMRFQLFLLGLALISPMLFLGDYRHNTAALQFIGSIGLTMIFLGYGCILVAAVHLSSSTKEFLARNALAKVVAWFGYNSFTIYLWHTIFLAGFLQLLTIPWHTGQSFIIQLLACVFTMSLGFCSTLLVERPFLKLREQLDPPKAKSSEQEFVVSNETVPVLH